MIDLKLDKYIYTVTDKKGTCMAGIERVCEYSGGYCGINMYDYKRDHIQIHPKYRKEFAGQPHKLVIKTKRKIFYYKANGFEFEIDKSDRAFLFFKVKTKYEYKYILEVPGLQGNVRGQYINWSCNIGNVKRRLKRLLKTRKLDIIHKEELTCKLCNGNDKDVPCAYSSKRLKGCLRAERLKRGDINDDLGN